jgi:alpha-acetolactate decarboxylase
VGEGRYIAETCPEVALAGPEAPRSLESRIDALVPQPNLFCAFRLRGVFRIVKTRSVPAQHKPYPPLAEVTRTQPVFTLSDVRGTAEYRRDAALVCVKRVMEGLA